MSIYHCMVCGLDTTSRRSFSKHVRDKHCRFSKEYYDQYLRKESDGVCIVCGEATKFLGLFEGYRITCNHTCGAIHFRKNLKEDNGKFQSFKEKVSANQASIWKNRELTGEKVSIIQKVAATTALINNGLTDKERAERYSRYHRCDEKTIDRLNKAGAEQLMRLALTGKNGYSKALKGRFRPKHPEKYKGDPTNIIFRSSYEIKAMKTFDENPNVLEWSSEEVMVPYYDPTTGRHRRYFPDFVVKTRQKDGSVKTLMIEVKPYQQTVEPRKRKRITRQYITEVTTWATNSGKWAAAREYCADKGWDFQLVTEKELNIKA